LEGFSQYFLKMHDHPWNCENVRPYLCWKQAPRCRLDVIWCGWWPWHLTDVIYKCLFYFWYHLNAFITNLRTWNRKNTSHICFTTVAYVHIWVAFDWFYYRKNCKKEENVPLCPKRNGPVKNVEGTKLVVLYCGIKTLLAW
jgi:hypothetical protein